MKIGIVTFHRAHNFGAVLQCFALKKALESRGNIVEIIDYWPSYRAGMYDLFDFRYLRTGIPFKKFIKGNLYSFLYTALNFFEKKERIKKFNDFIVQQLKVAPKANDIEWDKKSSSLDIYVFGSDQIWRHFDYPGKKGFDYVYWGEISHGRAKLITYAASMGKISDFERVEKGKISALLGNFDALSVRESSLSSRLYEVIGYHAPVVLDPVFLLSKDDWLRFFPEICDFNKKNKYLLLYNITKSKETEAFAKFYASANGLEIVRITADSSPFDIGREYISTPGPIDFLKYVYNADFVVSSSFHGVAFSVLFNKQFVSLGIGKNSDRVKSLLSGLGIEDRYLEEDVYFSSDCLKKSIDYSFVSKNLSRLLDQSYTYLEKNIK